MKRVLLFLLIILSISKITVLTSGCANIIPPAGGPKDSLPPVLEKANPGDSTRNFTGNKITFSFNEFVELQNAQQSLIISPVPKTFPVVEYKLNTVTVKMKDTLENNTTYSLNFGDAIKDFTEGNVLKNFTYVFSTGPYIDSLELKGNVILAESGKIDTTLIVMLHTSPDDSAVVKEQPRYFTKLDSKGQFNFKNLPPKKFYVYALKDDGGSHRYYDKKLLFAFADKPVTTGSNSEPVTLYAYTGKPAAGNTSTAPISLRNKLRGNADDKRLRYRTNLSGNVQDLLKDFVMTFEDSLKRFDSLKIRLYSDSTFAPLSSYRFEKDSTGKNYTLYYKWKDNTQYHLIMDKEFAEDTTGKKLLKTDTLSFQTKKLSDYGSLKLRFKNIDLSLNPVLLIMSGETIYKSYPMTGLEINEALFTPGDYDLRMLYDKNKNGKWDPGEFFGKHRQPEMVKPVDKKISVKSSFQNEYDITL